MGNVAVRDSSRYYENSLSKIRASNYKAALFDIEKAIQIELSNPVVYNSVFCKYYNIRGFCREKLGACQEANSDYKHAIHLNREVAESHIVSLKGYGVLDQGIVLKPINSLFKVSYIEADKFYMAQYKNLISFDLYKIKKKEFIQSWVEEHLDNKPDLEQSLAIGSVNSHVQLIARAGSGKTSTLVNRAIFLQKHCGIKSSEILLLAFNRKAAQEIRERLQKYLPNDKLPYAMTFHALAYHLVHPDETLIFDEPDGQQTRSRSLQSVIDEYIRNSDYSEQIKSLMIAKFRNVWRRISEGGYDLTPEEMREYRRSLPQVGIDGYNYKSGGEKIIADFLFEHDIPFKYEKNFWWRGVNYHPDFTIFKEVNGNRGIVIEYFGLQGDPNYDEQSEQKRHYWKEEQSDYLFIELNPAILRSHGREGMENHLRELLIGLGLELNRLSTPEIWERIKDRAIDEFTPHVPLLFY